MKANELMVGDWVLDTYTNKPMRIESINGGNPRFGQDLEPIPLTPEILSKIGFRRVNLQRFEWGSPEGYYININPKRKMMHINGKNRSNVNLYGQLSVHELQHALRLCGFEKEIELKEDKQ